MNSRQKSTFRKLPIVGILALAALPLSAPLLTTSMSTILTLNQMGIAVILAVSYNLLLGKAGLLSLGHAAYFGFGGFFAVHVINYFSNGDSWIVAPLIPFFGGLMGLVGAFILGSFTTRRGGLIFAMLSFAMAELVIASSTVFGRFYGGSVDRTTLPTFAGFDFQSDTEVFFIVWAWVVLAVGLAAWFNASPLGRMAEAAGQNSERAECLGYDQKKLKHFTFCVSGFLAGIAGGLFALTFEFVTVEIISLQQSWLILQMVFIGGTGVFWGPPLGAILLTAVFSGLSGTTENWNLYAGILFISIVLFAPNGLSGLTSSIFKRLRDETEEGVVSAYLLSALSLSAVAVGLVGILEMISVLNNPLATQAAINLFGISVNPVTLWPWITFGFLLVCGGYGFRTSREKLAQ
ncbi:MAG: branched-chain amino acid ABC transporter permease [Sneathiella sp.]